MNIETLNKFVSKDRKKIDHIFSQGEYTIATNGMVMVRIPRVEIIPEQTSPDVLQEFPIPEVKESFEIPDVTLIEILCNDCGGIGKEPKVCNKCKGSGRIECFHCGNGMACDACEGLCFAGKSDKDCPYCNGTGKVPDKHQYHLIDGIAFADHYLKLLKDNCTNIRITPREYETAYFTFDGGHGFLMPMRIP